MQSENTPRACCRSFARGACSFALASSLAFFGVFAIPADRAFAVTSAELQSQADELFQRIDALQTDLNAANTDYDEAVAAHDAAVEAMDDAQNRIDETQEQLQELQVRLSSPCTKPEDPRRCWMSFWEQAPSRNSSRHGI